MTGQFRQMFGRLGGYEDVRTTPTVSDVTCDAVEDEAIERQAASNRRPTVNRRRRSSSTWKSRWRTRGNGVQWTATVRRSGAVFPSPDVHSAARTMMNLGHRSSSSEGFLYARRRIFRKEDPPLVRRTVRQAPVEAEAPPPPRRFIVTNLSRPATWRTVGPEAVHQEANTPWTRLSVPQPGQDLGNACIAEGGGTLVAERYEQLVKTGRRVMSRSNWPIVRKSCSMILGDEDAEAAGLDGGNLCEMAFRQGCEGVR